MNIVKPSCRCAFHGCKRYKHTNGTTYERHPSDKQQQNSCDSVSTFRQYLYTRSLMLYKHRMKS